MIINNSDLICIVPYLPSDLNANYILYCRTRRSRGNIPDGKIDFIHRRRRQRLYLELYPRMALWPIYGFDFQICALGIGFGWRKNEKCHSAKGKESFWHISKESIVKAFRCHLRPFRHWEEIYKYVQSRTSSHGCQGSLLIGKWAIRWKFRFLDPSADCLEKNDKSALILH